MVYRQNVLRQNVPREKTSQGHKVPKRKVPGTIRPRDNTSQGTKRPMVKTFQGTKRPKGQKSYTTVQHSNYHVFKKHFQLENWPHTRMLGNGPHPCTQLTVRLGYSHFGEVRLGHSFTMILLD